MKHSGNTSIVRHIFWMAICVAFFSSCRRASSDQESYKKYSFHLMTRNGDEYLIQTDSLENGELDPLQGVPVFPKRHFYDLFPKNGYYYYLDGKNSRLVKAAIRKTGFEHLSEAPLEKFSSIENYRWITPDSLMIIGFDHSSGLTRYARINVNAMTANEGVVDIPPPSPPYNWMSIGFSRVTNGTILLGYAYHVLRNSTYFTDDTIRIDALSLPSMEAIERSYETRSIYPGGSNTQQSYSFTDENEDFYFITCPGIIAGNNPEKPTAIIRIQKGSNQPDPEYFFDISGSAINNNGYGFWYIGKGKALVRTERKELFTGIGDHYKVPHFDFHLIDLQEKTTIRLDLPLDKGSSRQCVLVEGEKVYITVNSDTEGSYVWLFNPKTMSLKKGLQFTGDVEYILRMDPM